MKKSNVFQVLFLHNDSSQDVEVQEMKQMDFLTVQERLERGESVFITARGSQKIAAPKPRSSHRSLKTRLVTAFSIDRVQP
jgi:hypothetical protein